jgi:hypothetical protein
MRHSAVATGLIVGFLWGTWHVLIAVWASRGLDGEASLTEFIAGFLAFYFVALPAYRVLMVWVYDRTQSLLVATSQPRLLVKCSNREATNPGMLSRMVVTSEASTVGALL